LIAMAEPSRRVAALLLMACALAGCSSLKTSGSANVSGVPIAYARAGQGDPPIVFQSGLGDDRSPWADVYRALQSHRTVLAYDRPGYGDSGAAAGSRDPCAIAAELRAVLAASGLKPPYLLVGHSLGGLYQYAFARLYPEDVAGLVLLDPTHPQHWPSMQREAPAAATTIQALRSTVFSAAARREFDQQTACSDRIEASGARPVPTRILVSTRASAIEGADFQRMLARLRDNWLQLTGAQSLDAVPGAGHYLQRDAPAAVVRAIEDLASGRASR
jgi:pimeloyl-ACP methyl ester carboxylesterase